MYKIVMVSGSGSKCDFATGFKTEKKATRFKRACEKNGFYIDKYNNRWTLHVCKEG
jgi:hypothetical protein